MMNAGCFVLFGVVFSHIPSLFLVLLMPIFFVLLYSNVNYILKGIAVYLKMG